MHTPFAAPISQEIWDMKYRLKDLDGTVHDQTVEDTWKRIADATAAPERDQKHWSDMFYSVLEDFKFLPAGRIIAGAGSGRNVTLFNCYVMGTIPDSMDGIFDMLKEAALTMQQGGGIGYDFSPIRPKGAPVKGVAADASGPLTFMDVWDAMCRTVMSAGSRRGAMMATMRCDHPDILQFIEAKQDSARLRMFNMSVLVTDAFMKAVERNETWELVHEVMPALPQGSPNTNVHGQRKDGTYVYNTVSARDLWEKIMRSTYDYAEPGVIFIDKINRDNNLWYTETIAATNPCGEQPLPPYGACLLGSINLARFVRDPFTPNCKIDGEELSRVVSIAVRMMDNVNDISKFPLRQQESEAFKKRRIGLGVTGLADMLAMMCVSYGSERGVKLAESVVQKIALAAYRASVNLAKEKGAFPLFKADEYLGGDNFATRLPEELQDEIRQHGIRNSHLTSIAPTGTISLYAGNVSSGIEPIFATSYSRKVLQPDGSRTEQRVRDYAVKLYRDLEGDGVELPDYFVTAQDLEPLAHVRMQAAIQKWVDTSISKTINVPEKIPFAVFEHVYMEAFRLGCKGCTTYRPNDVTGSVISVDEETETVSVEGPEDTLVYDGPQSFAEFAAMSAEQLTSRPETLDGKTYKVKLNGDPAFYVTVTDIVQAGKRRPFEVFINTKNPEHIAWSTALTMMISAIFRRPHDASFVVEELKSVFDPKGGGFWRGSYRPSVVAAIGQILEDHMRAIGYGSFAPKDDQPEIIFKSAAMGKSESVMGLAMPDNSTGLADPADAIQAQVNEAMGVPSSILGGPSCPKCFSFNLKVESGCLTCLDCGHSKCG